MRTWQRQPTAMELRGELERYVRQEVLYRETLARGYDRTIWWCGVPCSGRWSSSRRRRPFASVLIAALGG